MRALYIIIFAIPVAALFIIFPELDLKFTSLFYTDKFIYRDAAFPVFIYEAVKIIVKILGVSLLSLLAVNFIKKKNYILSKAKIIYLILCLAIGPGLIVNTVFKDNWDRARPSQITEFGGDKKFTPAFVMTDQCKRNCSFVSGHASVGFYLSSFAFVTAAFSWPIYISGIGLGLVFGLMRVVQGQHFLSDVIFSGVFVLLICHLIYYLMFVKKYKKNKKLKKKKY